MAFTEHLTQATDITLDFTQVIKINFQPDDLAVPEGYIKDSGKPYREAHDFGFGWVREDSLDNEIATPLDIRKNARDRKQAGIDPHLNTLLHMQYPQNSSSSKGVKVAAAWQCTIPNGTYNVTVSVGDATASDSVHQINIQGQPVISSLKPTETKKFFSITRLVTVSDRKLTIDAKGGTNTKINYVVIAPGNRPSVRITNIVDAETEVPLENNIAISADVNLPNSGIDRNTLTKDTVKLIDASIGTPVDTEPNTSAAGDVISLTPTSPLKPKTKYIFEVIDGIKDSDGVSFWPYSMSFTTGEDFSRLSTIVFEQVRLENVPSKPYSTVAIGPDKQLYAATLLGEILRFPINDDGTVGTPQTITSVQGANGGPRSIIGMCFDSSSTPDNLVLWISNNYFWDGGQHAPEWSGKLTKLSGPNLETVQDYVIDLPRSIRDHMTNSITCNPNEPNVLYVMQASNTAMGAPDKAWGKRPERLLTAAVLRVDLSKITSPPLSVKTEEEGTYDPFAPDAAVTIFASGVRNAYDCTWHSNGQLYIATNGSAAGGNTPGTPNPLPSEGQVRIDKAIRGLYTNPEVPALTDVDTQHDYLFRVVEGGYYGHPNPTRCEWVMNGGNPPSCPDWMRVKEYPLGTECDRNYRGVAFDFGLHRSPNGLIEYRSDVFGKELQGKLLVVRYSAGDDIIVLTPEENNPDLVKEASLRVKGFTGFNPSPLDLIENTANGHLYVAQLDENTFQGKITLLRPMPQS